MNKKPIIYFLSLFIIGILLTYQGLQQNHLSSETNQPLTGSLPTQVSSTSAVEATSTASLETTGLVTAQVVRVVDGDTVEVFLDGKNQKLRYIGINTPETVDPRRGVQCFGHEASDKNKSLVEGKKVVLTKDISNTDKYDRLLRFVYLPQSDGKLLFVNDYLVREGYAEAYTYPPDVKFADQFVAAQKEAQSQNKGLWGKCK